MSLFSALFGHAAEVSAENVQEQLGSLLIDGERVCKAFKLVRDLIVVTDKRLMFLDRQGVRGKKVEVLSIPYRSITRFSLESAGTFDLEGELKIWLSGQSEPITKEFSKNADFSSFHRLLSGFVLR